MESKRKNGNGIDARTRKLADGIVAQLKDQGIDLEDANTKLALKDIPFELLSEVRAALATSKIPALLSLVEDYEESDEPLVVGSDHLAPVEVFEGREGWATITGSIPPEERQARVDAFQAGELKGIAGTIKAMGLGYTLTRSHNIIINDLNWTPALNAQLEDRLCRLGQTRGVIVTRLVANHPLERRITELLVEKQNVIEHSVEASSVEEDYVGNNPAEALAKAAEKARQQVVDTAAAARQEREQKAQRSAEAQTQVKAELEASGITVDRDIEVRGKTRSAANAVEEWAGTGLVAVAGMDPDRASERNNVGFSAYDGQFGHSLAKQFADSGRFTAKQWVAAIRLATKYRRQIGPAPEVKV
jgi:hypothetical protein